jgi:hypothetical protein
MFACMIVGAGQTTQTPPKSDWESKIDDWETHAHCEEERCYPATALKRMEVVLVKWVKFWLLLLL